MKEAQQSQRNRATFVSFENILIQLTSVH